MWKWEFHPWWTAHRPHRDTWSSWPASRPVNATAAPRAGFPCCWWRHKEPWCVGSSRAARSRRACSAIVSFHGWQHEEQEPTQRSQAVWELLSGHWSLVLLCRGTVLCWPWQMETIARVTNHGCTHILLLAAPCLPGHIIYGNLDCSGVCWPVPCCSRHPTETLLGVATLQNSKVNHTVDGWRKQMGGGGSTGWVK